jgi:hypothetical protein
LKFDSPKKGSEGNKVEPLFWVSPKVGLEKFRSDNLQAFYGPHLISGNTLIEFRLGGYYCKHPVYPAIHITVVMSFV